MVQAIATQTFYVHPINGNDRNPGDATRPFRSLTRALRRATAGAVIQLAEGRYTTQNGERFPLVVPEGVWVQGQQAERGRAVVLEGGGNYMSPTFARQNIAIQMEDGSGLQGVTVVNRNQRGTGVWVESTAPAIAHCTFRNCGREGILTTGNANPQITDSSFIQNAASGVSFTRNTKGEIRRNLFQQTGYGIAINDNAAPLLTENRVLSNRAGIVISGSARPVLRNNLVESNTADGLVVMNNAVPDLGQSQDPGGNLFRRNGESDARNTSAAPLISVGNELNPTRVDVNGTSGSRGVEFRATTVNTQIQTAIPRPQPAPPDPAPDPSPPPTPTPTPPPDGPDGQGLSDIQGHWAEPFIRALVARDIISGYPDGSFRPEDTINRAQYAALISQAFDLPDRRSASGFVDVPAEFWAAGAIARAERMGFIAGFPDGSFRPADTLSRVQTVVSLVNGLALIGGMPEVLAVYRDRAEIPTYASVPVAIATQKRIVANHPDISRFEPNLPVSRAEIAVMVYQSLVVTGQARALASPYIVMPPAAAVSFSDITGHWAEGFIRGLAGQEFISGFLDGRFRPDNFISRAQYAALLVNTFMPLPKRPPTTFRDVPDNHWAADAIQRAYRGGLLSGNVDGTFRPDQNILRIEVLLSLVNGLNLPPGDPEMVNRYSDRASIPSVARPAVASATLNRLVVNYPNLNRLNPINPATRADVSAMVYQSLVYWGRSPSLPSPYIVSPSSNPTNSTPGGSSPETMLLIVIDPGHGGRDPGAIGINSLKEADVNLAIALETVRILGSLNLRVVLTRNDDRTLSLEDRVAIAEQVNAAAFVSIHANSAGLARPNVNGTETYYYPGSGASKTIATAIQSSIVQSLQVVDRGVKTANFFVLRNTSMPSVLVETGFITGAQDAARLVNTTFQSQMARAIVVGIVQSMKQPVG
ncbi:MAG: N-acetylmuramoyl-L-alanine amidase [Cyanobacteria bacterium J06638_22]